MAKVVACVSILLVLLVAIAESSPMMLCCTQYQKSEIKPRRLKDYTIQEMDYCKLEAVIFRTVKGKYVCGNPDDRWVQKAMENLPRKA